MVTKSKKSDLVVTRIFNVPVWQVWEAWTDPMVLSRWKDDAGQMSPLSRIDFREGGTSFVFTSSSELGDFYSIRQYRKIIPIQRIEYVHNLTDKNGTMIDPAVTGILADFPQNQKNAVLFKALGVARSELTIKEYGWTEGHMMEISRKILEEIMDKLAVYFAITPAQAVMEPVIESQYQPI